MVCDWTGHPMRWRGVAVLPHDICTMTENPAEYLLLLAATTDNYHVNRRNNRNSFLMRHGHHINISRRVLLPPRSLLWMLTNTPYMPP